MTGSIRVTQNSGDQAVLFALNFQTMEEYQEVEDLCVNRERASLFEADVIVIRTDSWDHLLQDLFLPNIFNQALRVNDLCEKILMGIVFFIWDVIFLPIRVITLIPRCFYNYYHSRDAHPLYRYLVQQGVDRNLLDVDTVHLELEKVSPRGRDSGAQLSGETFDFVQLHRFATPTRSHLGMTGEFTKRSPSRLPRGI